MRNITVTISDDTRTQARVWAVQRPASNDFSPYFACETVEPYQTSLETIASKHDPHSNTNIVHLWKSELHRKIFKK